MQFLQACIMPVINSTALVPQRMIASNTVSTRQVQGRSSSMCTAPCALSHVQQGIIVLCLRNDRLQAARSAKTSRYDCCRRRPCCRSSLRAYFRKVPLFVCSRHLADSLALEPIFRGCGQQLHSVCDQSTVRL